MIAKGIMMKIIKLKVRKKEDRKTVFDCETAKTFFEKTKGLMFSEKKNVLFVFNEERIFGIHSFFVFFPFDAVYLNTKREVVEVIRNINPFTTYIKNNIPAKYLLELCEKSDLKIGDCLEW
ncbi:MAG: DUF192 domain-containing protein [Candidatus Micrarchaeota archaeon]